MTVLLSALITMGGASAQSLPGWNLVWADEFEGPNIDSSKWSHEVNGAGGGNNELQYYTARATNSFIQDGKLIIQALKENYTGPDGTRDYTSARLRTLNKGDWKYGRFEARMKLPYGQGLWPAFWMMPTDQVHGGWAASGEIDIMELIGNQPNVVHGTLHYGGGWPNNTSSGGSWTLPSGDFSDDFHVFALEWEEGVMRWYVDGIHYSTKNSWFTTSGAPFPAPFDERFHYLLNVAVGGNWPGSPNATTVFPQQMVVDYVRVYSATNTPPPTHSGVLLNGDFETGALTPWVGNGLGPANPAGGNIVERNGLVYDPLISGNNTQGIKHPTFGNYSCKVYGAYNGSPNSTGFYQDVEALPGSVWTATLKARTQHTDHIRDDAGARVEVSFRNAANTVLAKYASQVFDTRTPTNTWIDLDVTHQVVPIEGTAPRLLAPPGTERIRFEVTFSQVLYDWGSIYFDEAKLQEVAPQPTTLQASLKGGNIDLRFPTEEGATYRLLYKDHMSDPDWTPFIIVTGEGTTMTISDPIQPGQRFYSVETIY